MWLSRLLRVLVCEDTGIRKEATTAPGGAYVGCVGVVVHVPSAPHASAMLGSAALCFKAANHPAAEFSSRDKRCRREYGRCDNSFV